MNTHGLIERSILALKQVKEVLPDAWPKHYNHIELTMSTLSDSDELAVDVRVSVEHAEEMMRAGASLLHRGWYGKTLQAEYGLKVDGVTLYVVIHPEHCEQLGLEHPAVAEE